MAKLSEDSPLNGMGGTIGKDLVFRTVNGETIVSQKPVFNPKKTTRAQKQTRSRFAQASLFAKKVTRDPLKKEYYKKMAMDLKLPNAYTAAIKEYMNKKEE